MLGDLSPTQIEHLLHSSVIGRIACHAGGRTYVVPVTYAYDGDCVYCHSAEGQKLRMMRDNPEVCFEVEQVAGMRNWRTVLAWGRFEELTGDEAAQALAFLMEHLAPLVASATAEPAHAGGGEAVAYRIRLAEKTGRFEKP